MLVFYLLLIQLAGKVHSIYVAIVEVNLREKEFFVLHLQPKNRPRIYPTDYPSVSYMTIPSSDKINVTYILHLMHCIGLNAVRCFIPGTNTYLWQQFYLYGKNQQLKSTSVNWVTLTIS